MLTPALAAGNELNATVANMRSVKPVDRGPAPAPATTHDLVVFMRRTVAGGAGAVVAEALAADGISVPAAPGLPDAVEHGDPQLPLRIAVSIQASFMLIRERMRARRRPGKVAQMMKRLPSCRHGCILADAQKTCSPADSEGRRRWTWFLRGRGSTRREGLAPRHGSGRNVH
jgi:hypothetical protein